MRKILAVGDIHVKRQHIKTSILFKDKLIKLCLANEFDMVVLLGDAANDFEKMHIQCWSVLVDMFKDLNKLGIPIKYIVGNHDMLNNQVYMNSSENFFHIFNELENVEVHSSISSDSDFIYCPYVPVGRFNESIEKIDDFASKKIIFAHQEFFGSKMGAIKSRHGDKWNKNNPLVVSGHIHERDWLQDNILYVGSPYDTAYGSTTKKTVELITIEDSGEIATKTLDMDMPKKISIETNCENFANIENNDKDYVRIVLKDSEEKIKILKKTSIYKEFDKKFKIVVRYTDTLKVKKDSIEGDFVHILKNSIEKESENVKCMFEEIIKVETNT